MNEPTSELQQTELGKSIDKVNNAIEPYSKPIMLGVVVIAAAVIGWVLYQSGESGKRSQSTLQLIEAVGEGDAERLNRVVATFPETVSAGWAALFRGDETLASGINQLYKDRESGLVEIETAQEAYRQAKAIGGDALLISRANFGLAKAAESVGDTESAVAAYQDVIAAGESDQMRKYAEGRIKLLEKPQTEEFLAWFNEQDFAPASTSMPPALPGMGSLPGLPDLDLPELTLSSDDPVEDESGDPADSDDPTESDDSGESDAAPESESASADEPSGEPAASE